MDDSALLERLEDELRRFEETCLPPTVFSILRVSRRELTHSDFLAFLLTPAPTGWGNEQVLQRLLEQVFGEEFRSWSLRDTTIHREFALSKEDATRVDLVIDNPSEPFVVVLENKIDAGAGEFQLQGYRGQAEHTYRKYQPPSRRKYVYLTPHGHSGSEGWESMTYGALLHLLKEVDATGVDPRRKLLLEDYIRLLETEIVPSKKITRECQRIYAEHAHAFEVLLQHVGETRQRILALVARVLQNGGLTDERFDLQEESATTLSFRVDAPGIPTDSPLLVYLFLYGGSKLSAELRLKADDDAAAVRLRSAGISAEPHASTGEPVLLESGLLLSRDVISSMRPNELVLDFEAKWNRWWSSDDVRRIVEAVLYGTGGANRALPGESG